MPATYIFNFNVNVLLTKCYTWLKKQNFSIFFRALNSAQVVFLSVSNLFHRTDFEGQFMVSDMNEVFTFPRNFRVKMFIM